MAIQIGPGINITSGITFASESPPLVTSGLVLYVDAALSSSYPGSGTTWTDLSGAGNTATMTGSPAPSYDSLTKSFALTYGGYFTFPNLDLANIPWTISCLFRRTSTSDFNLIGGGAGGGSAAMHLIVRSNVLYMGLYANDIAGTTTINANTWYYATFQVNASGQKVIYLNSALEAGPSGSTYYQSYINQIYMSCCGGTAPGNISCVQIYNRALTTYEITQNYNAFRSRYGI